MFILITDSRVCANNTFSDGCHFKVKEKYRSQKPLTPSMIILLKVLCDDSVITEGIATGTLSDLEDSTDF